jgi:hypothetical protein
MRGLRQGHASTTAVAKADDYLAVVSGNYPCRQPSSIIS